MDVPPSLPTAEVSQLPEPLPEGVVVLDVREPTEWVHGHVPGAVHLPLSQIGDRLDELPEQEVLVVCRVGARSAQVVAWLDGAGRPAVNLHGGLLAWEAAGRPLVSENGQTPRVV